ncbi:MAG: aminopeptidase [Verrucomicrobiae bacterium]|nr:aminopeptidase [Verrucomicrobiae bacterium]
MITRIMRVMERFARCGLPALRLLLSATTGVTPRAGTGAAMLWRLAATGRRFGLVTLWVMGAVVLTGCQTAGFYLQAARGQAQIILHKRSCEKLLAHPDTPMELKAKLQLAREMCDFAKNELKLPANGHYRHYADVGRRYVVWNVTASPEFSLESKSWWYPVVGSLDYRGYFVEAQAHGQGSRLWARGFDVSVEGIEAYSTLGWFKDPLLNTFVHHSEAALAELLFHELAHQRVFARGDTDFNEAFATAVAETGVRRWLRAQGDTEVLARYEQSRGRNVQFVQLVQNARHKLAVLYGDEHGEDGGFKATRRQHAASPVQVRQEKQRIFGGLRRDHEQLKSEWNGYAGYDAWFDRPLNNAHLNTVAAYYDLVPAFVRLLEANEGDLETFYAAVKRLAKLPKAERHRQLHLPQH